MVAVGAKSECKNATGTDSLSYAGAVYLFEKNKLNEWTQTEKIVASDRNSSDHFGEHVMIDSGNVMVASKNNSYNSQGADYIHHAGAVYFFEFSEHTGINSDFGSVDFIIYPNPVKSSIYIKSEKEIESLHLYSLLGELVGQNQFKNSIDVSELSGGLYWAQVHFKSGKIAFKKFIKK